MRELQAFLAERGHRVGLWAIKRHRQKFRAEFRSVREAAQMAEAFCRVTGEHGRGAFLDAAQGNFEMRVMQNLLQMKQDETLGPEQWQAWGKALDHMAKNRRHVEELRVEFERRVKQAATECEKVAGSGATGRDVVARMREILGV